MAPGGIVYGIEANLSAEEFRRVLIASGLAVRRPADDLKRLDRMLRAADLVITARTYTPERQLVGIARTLTDFAYCAYLADLAVDRGMHGHGIGRGLIEETRTAIGPASLLLTAAPDAVSFYEHIAMPRVTDAFRYAPRG
jgi:GNAT superfamily N-acetyltransferase